MTAVRVLDQISRPAPIGIRFRDVATGRFVDEGLRVTVTSMRNPSRRAVLEANAKAVWYANRFPGFSDEALGRPDWEALQQQCLLEVDDAHGRFLPLRIVLDLPQRGLVDWPGWGDLPQDLLAPWANDESPPAISPETLPLFSAPGRAAPAPLAEIRCQLLRDDGGPAAWTLLTASHAGTVRALGQADAEGRAVLFFGYPERPRPSLATSPPAITDFRWSIELAAYWGDLDPARPPELAALMAQLDHPRTLFASTASPPEPLPSQLLSFGRGLVLRTDTTPDGPSSSLVMAAS